MVLSEEEIRGQIETLSQQVNDLYKAWMDVDRRRDKIRQDYSDKTDPADEEKMQQLLADLETENEKYGYEYERLKSELDDLYEKLDAIVPERRERIQKEKPAATELEKITLHRRLNEIADAQNEAIRNWNQNPIEEHKAAFEQRLQHLHDEFSRILARLDELGGGEQMQ